MGTRDSESLEGIVNPSFRTTGQTSVGRTWPLHTGGHHSPAFKAINHTAAHYGFTWTITTRLSQPPERPPRARMTCCVSHIASRACTEVQGRLGKYGPFCLCSSRPEWKFSRSRKRVQIWGRKLTSGHSCSTQPTFGKHPRADRPQEGRG